VAYCLELLSQASIHPVIHMSQLKKTLGLAERFVDDLSPVESEGLVTLEPKWIIDFHWVKLGKKIVQEALVSWVGLHQEDATWERFSDLQNQFPHLNLEDKIRLEGEGNVVTQAREDSTHIEEIEEIPTEVMEVGRNIKAEITATEAEACTTS
jgi:hypothetical protein